MVYAAQGRKLPCAARYTYSTYGREVIFVDNSTLVETEEKSSQVVHLCDECGKVLEDYYYPLNGKHICGECAYNALCELVSPVEM